jgi:hypothetical protein
MAVPAGLCARCVQARSITSSRGSVFIQCQLSFVDPRFPKYPRLPVVECSGYQPAGSAPPCPGDRRHE